MTKGNKSSYRQVMKATTIFGGVQFIQIIIQIVRSKFVAVLLGPSGMGIAGLLNSTLALIGGLTNFGLGTSAVKIIAEANGTKNDSQIATVVSIVHKLVWVTGLFGLIISILFSSWLSQITFGNEEYSQAFVWLSITLLLNQLSNGNILLLQGMQKLQYLAMASTLGSFMGLFFTLPLYYKYGMKGIVPGMIISSIISLLVSLFYSKKIDFLEVKVSFEHIISESKEMLKMGFLISMSSLITLVGSYVVRIFVGSEGSLKDVGLYNAGFTIINTYVGLVFTAMGTDFYPRLSSLSQDNEKSIEAINQQAEIALLILAPILIVFLVFIKWIIIFLYSNQFVAVSSMIYWMALGMFFKSASWSIAFIFLARGKNKLFFLNELFANIYMVGFNVLGFYFFGLTGLGISFLISYIIYLLQVYIIAKNYINFQFSFSFLKIFSIQFILAFSTFLLLQLMSHPIFYFLGSFLIAVSFCFSYIEINKRLDILELIREKILAIKT